MQPSRSHGRLHSAWWKAFRDALVPSPAALLDALLPSLCALCGAGAERLGLCASCWVRLSDAAAACDEPPPPPGIEGWRAGGLYAGEAAAWMRRFKYPAAGVAGIDTAAEIVIRAHALCAAARLPLCADARLQEGPASAPEAVLPVPAHPGRSRRRGFRPTLFLARSLARQAGAPLYALGLRCTRDTPSQTGLDRSQRRRNVAGAFAPTQALPRHVWLVDDLFTTGATLAEAARAARRGGARRVQAVAALWTPEHGDAGTPR